MHKKETELELAWRQRWSTTATMRARRSSGGDVGKTEERKEERRRRLSFIGQPRKQEEDTSRLSPRQREAKGGHRHDWKPGEARRRWQLPATTVQRIYRIAIRQISQITPKFT